MKYLSLILVFAFSAIQAQELVSVNNQLIEGELVVSTEKPQFAPDFHIATSPNKGELSISGLAATWENIILRSLDGRTVSLIPNDQAKSPTSVQVDLSREKSGTYFCEVEYSDKSKNVKTFRLP